MEVTRGREPLATADSLDEARELRDYWAGQVNLHGLTGLAGVGIRKIELEGNRPCLAVVAVPRDELAQAQPAKEPQDFRPVDPALLVWLRDSFPRC